MNRFAFAALAALLVGCPETDKTDSGTTDTGETTDCTTIFSGPTVIETADASCSGTTVTVTAETQGWTGNGIYYAIDHFGGTWDEQHPIDSKAFDPCRAWDQLELTLEVIPDDPIEPGVTTIHNCTYFDDDALTHLIAVNDVTTGEVVDCLIWGADVADVKSGTMVGPLGGPDLGDYNVADCVEGVAAR